MQINIINDRYSEAIDEDSLINVIRQLAAMAQCESGCDIPWSELSVYILDDESIAEIHSAVQGIEGSTDVITQRYDPVPGEPDGLSGEIFVNLQCAILEAAVREEWSVDKELALYIAHGCDHLNNNEDESEAGFESMRARELAWLAQLRLTPLVIKPII